MKNPTIGQVRVYFKNADTVKTIYNKIIKIGDIDHGLWGSFVDKETSCTVWSKQGGYAEILTTK